jgi:hypothetical protein
LVTTISSTVPAATALEAASISWSTAISTAKSATATKTTWWSAETSATSTKASAANDARSIVGVAVLTDFEHASLPVVAVEVLDGVLSVVGGIESYHTGALGCAIWSHVDISAHDVAALTEEVLEILPADGVGNLRNGQW